MAKSDEKVFAKYTGSNGDYFLGVPPRDLTKADFDALAPIQQRDVRAGTIYSVSESVSKASDDGKSSGDGSESK